MKSKKFLLILSSLPISLTPVLTASCNLTEQRKIQKEVQKVKVTVDNLDKRLARNAKDSWFKFSNYDDEKYYIRIKSRDIENDTTINLNITMYSEKDSDIYASWTLVIKDFLDPNSQKAQELKTELELNEELDAIEKLDVENKENKFPSDVDENSLIAQPSLKPNHRFRIIRSDTKGSKLVVEVKIVEDDKESIESREFEISGFKSN